MTAALLSYKRKVAYYALLGFGIGVMNFAGIVAATRIAVTGMVNSETILSASQYSVRAWGLMPLLFFMAPLFSVILGSFIGEWLESSQPSGRKMEYSRNLAKQITGMSSGNAPSEMDIDKLSELIAAIAPLIAAIGGIVVPIVTALSR